MANKTTAQALADGMELTKAKKEHRLPDNLTTTKPRGDIQDLTRLRTTLAYLLTDVVYTLMTDNCIQMQQMGVDLRHESKRRFNAMFADAERFRNSARRASGDIAMLNEDDILTYINDSDNLRDNIECMFLISRSSEDAAQRLRFTLLNELNAPKEQSKRHHRKSKQRIAWKKNLNGAS